MRVEHCGDLLAEPNLLRQQPSAVISSHCSDRIHQARSIQFSELNRLEVPVIGCKLEEYILDNGNSEQGGGVFGFTLNQEEWSHFNKSHLADLEPYERRKMCSLPKSFTPFSSTTVGEDGLENDRNFNGIVSGSILLRKCESLNPTPSQYLLNGNEPNNNNITHPSSLSKIMLLQKSHEGFQEDEKENWLSDDGWNHRTETALSEKGHEESVTDGSTSTRDREKEESQSHLWVSDTSFQHLAGFQQHDMKEPEVDVEVDFLPSTRYPLPHTSNVVGTIGSHPNPISSCAADQVHCHQHQDLSTTQQASFPSTVYNYHRHLIDPMCYAECFDEWNANVASLCENAGTNGTPVLYPDILSVNGLALHSQQTVAGPSESRFLGYANYGRQQTEDLPDSSSGRAVEEVNTLSTFLSKFDDKVAAIWGHQGRSALGINNYLSIEGCISAASTPMGSSNPWGSPSSDISTIHGAPPSAQHDYRLLQQQSTKQMSLAADALLSGGYGIHHHDNAYHQCDQKSTSNANRVSLGDLTLSPPKGNYNIMHSMKQYFGTAPPEGEYHIIKRNEATSSAEDLELSLSVINHDQDNAGFVSYCHPNKLEANKESENGIAGERDIDLNTMTKALHSIDLEENDATEEWEIVEACNKEKAHGYDSEDLLNSWKTHFRTIEQVESIASARGIDLLESPVTTISAHQINPNLPEYRLFDADIDGEYRVFNRPGQTIFPVKYKVCRENEKGNQTDDSGVDVSFPVVESTYFKHTTSDWTNYMSVPPFDFSQGTLGTLPRSTTPTICDVQRAAFSYDCDNSAEFQSEDWYNVSKGVEYNGMWGEWLSGDDASNNTLLPSGGSGGGEYCDSGVGGVGSRSDFYDDMFGEYEGDYENFSGIGFSFQGFVGTTETDTDYGQFQDISGLAGCDSLSISGKQGKSSRRNKTRLRPCKYFFMEGSCRRGNDCKFSHDSVTCRYWAEGSCLKGQTCPYVHCFIEGKKMASQDEYGIVSNGTEKQYHLESETDFPALSSTKNTMLSSRQPVALGFSSSVAGDGVRRLEDSLESLTVFTDSNSSVVDEDVTETRRLFLFERLRASPVTTGVTAAASAASKERAGKSKHNGGSSHKTGEPEHWSEGNSRTLSKSKSVGDANSSSGNSSWSRHHSVTRSNSHSSTTGMSLGIPVKEKRKKKKH